MLWKKTIKKRLLQFHQVLKKKIDTTSISTSGKKSFDVKKKEPFRGNKNTNKVKPIFNQSKNTIQKRKTLQENLLNNKLPKLL